MIPILERVLNSWYDERMARLARAVIPNCPHHVTQRGNRRQATFFCEGDYALYLELVGQHFPRYAVELWAYCLMPNHVHLLACPTDSTGLARAMGEVHRRYTREINFREEWRGFLWQGRFSSFPLDEAHAVASARYIELNPVRAKLARRPEDWRWSSARAHLRGDNAPPLSGPNLLRRVGSWRALLRSGRDEGGSLRRHERTGRPLGSEAFVAGLERTLDRPLAPRRAGRKKSAEGK